MIDPPFRSPRERVGAWAALPTLISSSECAAVGAQVHIWNEFARKLGSADRVAQFLLKVKAEDGTAAETADLSTAFELTDYREGRRQLPKTPLSHPRVE